MIVTMKRCLAALGIAAVAATAARAEQLGPKWQGWIGCWTPTAAGVSYFTVPGANGLLV
jgi:ABC-type sugar transport system substrate-binding protein